MPKIDIGIRMKNYEFRETKRRTVKLLPVYARIDGVNFSKLTKGMKRPYDAAFSDAMIQVTRYLVEQTNSCIGYTQSDEINLLWYSDNYKTQIFNDGKIQKMVSKLAAMASVKFYDICKESTYLCEFIKNKTPIFDSRVFELPNLQEAANVILWREMDATKNSISAAAQTFYSHNKLTGKNSNDMQEMLFQKGVNWNDYPEFFKRGTFIQRRKVMKTLTKQELERIPEKHRLPSGESALFERNVIKKLTMPPFVKVINRAGVIFRSEQPKTNTRGNNDCDNY